jgi:hypothetical protein
MVGGRWCVDDDGKFALAKGATTLGSVQSARARTHARAKHFTLLLLSQLNVVLSLSYPHCCCGLLFVLFALLFALPLCEKRTTLAAANLQALLLIAHEHALLAACCCLLHTTHHTRRPPRALK